MTNEQISKVIEYIKQGNKDDALNVLITELAKGTGDGKKNYNIISLVKNIFKSAGKTRPILQTIQTAEDGKQIITDGFVAVKWESNEELLNNFEKTPRENSVKLDGLFRETKQFTPTENDILIINNIDKAKSLIKAESEYFDKNTIIVKLLGKFFNLSVIENGLKMLLVYDQDLKQTKFYTESEQGTRFVLAKNKNISVLMCPYATEDKEQPRLEERTEKIAKLLKGE